MLWRKNFAGLRLLSALAIVGATLAFLNLRTEPRISSGPKATSDELSSGGNRASPAMRTGSFAPMPPPLRSAAAQTAAKRTTEAEANQDHRVHRHLIRSRKTDLESSLRAIASAYREAGLDRFSLPAFDGESVHVAIRRARDHALGGTVISGSVLGEPSSRVTLAEKDDAISGVVRWSERNLVYEIRPLPGGGISIGEVDLHALGECGVDSLQHTASRTNPP